jgi:protein-disulfide isomerase
MAKYVFTPEKDKELLYTYSINTDNKPRLINLGRKVGVGGTPTLFMNGKRMKSRSFGDFKEAIEGYLKQQGQKKAS